MPFLSQRIVVEEFSDTRWRVVEPIVYQADHELFTVPAGFQTDFASVPRFLTWLIPTYGRYTKAAILHDWLWSEAACGRVDRSDADGIFCRAMRELDVPFLRRWLMWAAVRLGGVTKPGPWGGGFPDAARLAVIALPSVVFLLAPGIVVVAAMALFWLAEAAVFVGLKLFARRRPSGTPDKAINPPIFTTPP
nr:DUF1353 domain-containing protein [Micromonospora sp. DSM 115978]